MRDVFIANLLEEAEKDSRICLITGDLGFKVLDDFREKLPMQFLNAGVAEQNMTGLAVGMALEGKIVFTYSIANFPTLRCLEQIRNSACYHDANVKIVSIGAGFSYGPLGISHHATEDISIMRSLPNITICSPGCDWEVSECTKAIIRSPGTAYLRLDRSSAGNTRRKGEKFVFGAARQIRDGEDVTFITTGGILGEVIQAAEILEREGIKARIINYHTIKPFDPKLLFKACSETGGIITVEEHTIEGGLGGLVAENILEGGPSPVFFLRLGLKDGFSSVVGSQDYLRARYGIDKTQIAEAARLRLAGLKSGAA